MGKRIEMGAKKMNLAEKCKDYFNLDIKEGNTTKYGLVVGCALDIMAQKCVNYSHIDLSKTVVKLRKNGYSDYTIFTAIEMLQDRHFLVPDNYGQLNGYYRPKEKSYPEQGNYPIGTHFPIVGKILDSELKNSEVLGELTGVQDAYVSFYKMKDNNEIECYKKAANW